MGRMDDAITELEAQLVEMWRRGRARTRDRAAAINPRLDPTCYPLLVTLRQQGQLSMSALGAELNIEKSTLTRQIDAVARLGLAQRTSDPDDARVRLVSLTDDGARRVDAVTGDAISEWRTRLAAWDQNEVRELTRLLAKLAAETD